MWRLREDVANFLTAFVDFTVTGCIRPPPASSPLNEEYIFPKATRVVAVGDLHGDYDAARRAFCTAGLVDGDDHWIGGEATCVQVCVPV